MSKLTLHNNIFFIKSHDLLHRPNRRVYIPDQPLTEKQKQVIKAMQNGAFIEGTSGCYRCNGIHLTKKSFTALKKMGLIFIKERVGYYSTIHELTEKGLSINIKNESRE